MKKVYLIFLIIASMSAVCGCTADIETTVVNGVHKKMSHIEEELISTSDNNADILLFENHVFWKYSNDVSKVVIDADINNINSSNIKVGNLEFVQVDKSKICNLLFVNKDCPLTETYNSDNSTIDITNANFDISPDEHSQIHETISIGQGSISYTNNYLMNNVYVNSDLISENVKTKLNLTKQEAEEIIISLIDNIGLNEVAIVSTKICLSEITQTECYYVYFTTKNNGIMYEYSNTSSPDMIKLNGVAVIGDEGIGSISGIYLLEPFKDNNIDIKYNIGCILEILTQYIDYYFGYAEEIYIDNISINYCVKRNSANELNFYPVWVLSINKEQSSDISLLPDAILINIQTGQLEALN